MFIKARISSLRHCPCEMNDAGEFDEIVGVSGLSCHSWRYGPLGKLSPSLARAKETTHLLHSSPDEHTLSESQVPPVVGKDPRKAVAFSRGRGSSGMMLISVPVLVVTGGMERPCNYPDTSVAECGAQTLLTNAHFCPVHRTSLDLRGRAASEVLLDFACRNFALLYRQPGQGRQHRASVNYRNPSRCGPKETSVPKHRKWNDITATAKTSSSPAADGHTISKGTGPSRISRALMISTMPANVSDNACMRAEA